MILKPFHHAPLGRWWIEQVTYQVDQELKDYSWLSPLRNRVAERLPYCDRLELIQMEFRVDSELIVLPDWQTATTLHQLSLKEGQP